MTIRKTDYADLLKEAILKLGDGQEARLERLFVKARGEEEIRFSWWCLNKNGVLGFANRPLDLNEDELFRLFKIAMTNGVLSENFRAKLKAIL